MDNSHNNAGYLLGRNGGALLLLILLIYFLRRASRSDSRSLQAADLALCCGLAGLLVSSFVESLWFLGALSGLLGVTFDVLAVKARRRDQGTGLVRVIFGLALSILALLGNASHFLLPILVEYQADRGRVALEEPGAGAWIYRSVEHDFQLSLPSPRWANGDSWKGSLSSVHVAFTHPSRLELSLESMGGQAEDAFTSQASEHASMVERIVGSAGVQHAQGVNPRGCRYASTTARGRNKRHHRFFFVDAVIWCADKQFTTVGAPGGALIQLSFSGEPGKRVSEELLERTARFIIDSVEDGS